MDWEPLVSATASLLVTVASVAVGYLARWLRAKAIADLSDAEERQLEQCVARGISFAEEWARNRLRVDHVETDSELKMATAVDYVRHTARRKLGEPEARTRIEAELGRMRMAGDAPPPVRDTLPPPPRQPISDELPD